MVGTVAFGTADKIAEGRLLALSRMFPIIPADALSPVAQASQAENTVGSEDKPGKRGCNNQA